MPDDALEILVSNATPSQERLNALLYLVEEFEPEYLPVLETILKDPTEPSDIRSAVALALGKIAGEKPFDILKPFYKDDDHTVRNYVIRALGMTHEEAAIPLLIEALKDKDNNVFAAASEALGDLGSKAIPYLIPLLSEGAEDARCVAAWQLGEISSSQAVPALAQAIQSEENVSVIALCIWALGEIGMSTPEVLAILSQAKLRSEPDIRLRAETAIKKIVRHSN